MLFLLPHALRFRLELHREKLSTREDFGMAKKTRKKTEAQTMAVKKKLIIMHAKGLTLNPEDIRVRAGGSRAPTSALLGGRGRGRGGRNVILADMDATDSVFIFDHDVTDPTQSIDFDHTDPI
jgi:hypothetical protein